MDSLASLRLSSHASTSHSQAQASTSSSSSIFDFPLDPSLSQTQTQGTRFVASTQVDQDSEEDEEEDSTSEESEEDEEGESDDTDAEDEYRMMLGESSNAVTTRSGGGGTSKKRKAKGSGETMGKGKGKEVDSLSQAGTQGEGDDSQQELSRLISAIRDSGSTTVGGRTALDQEFDRSIEEELAGLDEPEDKQKGSNTLGKKGYPTKRPPRRVGRHQADPSPEVKKMLGRANEAYIKSQLDLASSILMDVIRIDPTIKSCWYTLASIHEELGEMERGLGFKIVAAHLNGERGGAEEWKDLGAQARDHGLLGQAIYCYTHAIRGAHANALKGAGQEDIDSMWDRAILIKMSGNVKQAIQAFSAILAEEPHDPGVIRELVPLLVSTDQHTRATDLYLAAFEHHQRISPHIPPHEAYDAFLLEDLETLSDLLIMHLKFYSKAVSIIRTGVRWLQGREMQTAWDSLEDDREFDLDRKEREGWEKMGRGIEESEVFELDVRLRVRLGAARMGEGKVEEAKHHFDILLKEDVELYPLLYGHVADVYLNKRMYSEALEFYSDVSEVDEHNGPPLWMKIGKCHHELGDLEAARDCYEAVAAEEPSAIPAKMQLARLYEQMKEPEKALAMITDVILAQRSNRERENANPSTETRRKSTNRRAPLTREDRIARAADQIASEQQRVEEFGAAFHKLSVLDPGVEEEDKEAIGEWLEVATYLVDSFRETTQLFPSDSKKKFSGVLSRNWTIKGAEEDIEAAAGEMASRLERNLAKDDGELAIDSFRGLEFDKWLTLIMKYAFLLTKNDNYEAGEETLTHISSAAPFKQSEARTTTIALARAACAQYMGNSEKVSEIVRRIWVRHQFRTDSLQLFQAILPSGISDIEAFNMPSLQKFAIRQIKGVSNSANAGKGNEEDLGDEEEGEREGKGKAFAATKLNPLYFTAYGTMMLTSRSYQSAILYLLRAYELMPEAPLINLLLAVAYTNRAMSRQTDNRHHQIAQGMACMVQYRKALGVTQEVEYNFGRVFHSLGLVALAVRHYEAVLTLSTVAQAARIPVDETEEDSEEVDLEDFSKLAAYNLSNLHLMSGNADVAREVARKWLSV